MFTSKCHVSYNSFNSIKTSNKTLEEDPTPGDYDRLLETMSCLAAVKARQVATNAMFEPLKRTIELLKSYGQTVSQEILLLVEVRKSA